MADQKRWEAEKARQAPVLKEDIIDELISDELPTAPVMPHFGSEAMHPEREMTEAEYMLLQEEYELQALVAAMEEEQENHDTASQHYGSDDDVYDEIFRECTVDENVPQQPSHPPQFASIDLDAMDMTDG